MKVLKNNFPISKILGQDYSIIKKIKLRGTGSTKIIYVKGIESFDALAQSSNSHSFANFQLYPKGLVVRLSKSNKLVAVVIKKEEILNCQIVARKIKAKVRRWGVIRYKIVHDAQITITLDNESKLVFYSLTAHYKALLPFFQKAWLKDKFNFSIDPAEPIIDSDSLVAELLLRLLS